MRNWWSMSTYMTLVIVVAMKKGPYTLFAEGSKRVLPLGYHEHVPEGHVDFSCSRPAVVGIDLTTDMKRALITENYGVQKSLSRRHTEP
jgi:hypothetical protein